MIRFRPNLLPATGAQAIYSLRSALLEVGAIVLSSSDGTTYSAAGDNLTSANSGANGLNNTSAWFVVRMPDGRQFCFQRGASAAAWRIKQSISAGFVGGTPGAARVPSAADEIVALGLGSDAAPTYSPLFAADGTYVYHVGVSTTEPRVIVSFCWTLASAQPQYAGCFVLDPIQPDPASVGLVDPYVLWVLGAGSGPGAGPYDRPIAPVATNPSAAGGLFAYVTAESQYRRVSAVALTTSGGTLFPGGCGANAWDGHVEYAALPYARYDGGDQPAVLGVSTVLGWSGSTHPNASKLTLTSTRSHVAVGELVFPWWGGP